MGLLDMLSQLSNASQVQDHHYDQVAQQAGPDMLGSGLAEAFRSDQTPPMGDMVSQLFGQSSGQQQAGMLNQILASLGPAAALAGAARHQRWGAGRAAGEQDLAARGEPDRGRVELQRREVAVRRSAQGPAAGAQALVGEGDGGRAEQHRGDKPDQARAEPQPPAG